MLPAPPTAAEITIPGVRHITAPMIEQSRARIDAMKKMAVNLAESDRSILKPVGGAAQEQDLSKLKASLGAIPMTTKGPAPAPFQTGIGGLNDYNQLPKFKLGQ